LLQSIFSFLLLFLSFFAITVNFAFAATYISFITAITFAFFFTTNVIYITKFNSPRSFFYIGFFNGFAAFSFALIILFFFFFSVVSSVIPSVTASSIIPLLIFVAFYFVIFCFVTSCSVTPFAFPLTLNSA